MLFRSNVTAAVLSVSLGVVSPGAFADSHYEKRSLSDDQTSASNKMSVRLIVSREKADGTTAYERIEAPYDEVEDVRADLLKEPDVIAVEINMPVSSPDPVPPTSSSQSVMKSMANDSTLYDDALFENQDYFDPESTTNSRVSLAHERVPFTNKVRVGIIDGGFVRNDEAPFVEGVSFDFGRGPDFYNSDPSTGCSTVSNPSIHGFHVAQVVGSQVNNGIGLAGVSANVELVAGRVLDCDGFGYDFEISEAVRWMAGDVIDDLPTISEPVDVINMSLSGENVCASYMQDAFAFARAQGIPIVVAAGNLSSDSENYSPGNCDGAITVASTDTDGTVSGFSNTGTNVDVAAQGSDIFVLNDNGSVSVIQGTSFSAPLSAGLIAIALSEHPGITPSMFDAMLANSGKPVTVSSGPAPQVGAGILDAMLLLDAAGVPRETLGLQSALSGEREQYAEALLHSEANDLLMNARGVIACDLVEINATIFNDPDPADPLVVFSVPEDRPLVPNGDYTVIESREAGQKVTASIPDLEAEEVMGRQIGVSKCDLTNSDTCSPVDTVRAINLSEINKPAACDAFSRG